MQPPASDRRLLLVGASCRAAAWSAHRAGYRPICLTQFRDADLVEVAETLVIDDWPNGVVSQLDQFPGIPLIALGGFDLQIELLERLVVDREIVGLPFPARLAALRDPSRLAEWSRSVGLEVPAWVGEKPSPPVGWICKQRWTAGGTGVFRWDSAGLPTDADCYWQRFQPGRPCGAILLAARGAAYLLGACWMIPPVCPSGETPSDFRYRGSLGPRAMPIDLGRQLEGLAAKVAENCAIRGLLNIDFIEMDDGNAAILEVNPRYSSSGELIERACGVSLIQLHLDAATGRPPAESSRTGSSVWAKRIVYARADWVAPPNWPTSSATQLQGLGGGGEGVWLADLPFAGQRHAAGVPVVTIISRAQSEASAMRLVGQAEQLLEDRYRLRSLRG